MTEPTKSIADDDPIHSLYSRSKPSPTKIEQAMLTNALDALPLMMATILRQKGRDYYSIAHS